jgi:hypothetical protein
MHKQSKKASKKAVWLVILGVVAVVGIFLAASGALTAKAPSQYQDCVDAVQQGVQSGGASGGLKAGDSIVCTVLPASQRTKAVAQGLG